MSDDILIRQGSISKIDLMRRNSLDGLSFRTQKERDAEIIAELLPPLTPGYKLVEIQTEQDLANRAILWQMTERRIPGAIATPNAERPLSRRNIIRPVRS